MALLGILVALVFVALPFYQAGDKDSSASIDAAAAQALGAVVAAMALLVAVWAVNVTDKIARKIETSGMNDDTIAANSKLHDQWQTINLEFIRNDKLRLSWEPEVEGDSEVPGFETRLAFTFYIMQILRLTMLYEKNHINVSLEDASKLYWAHWLTRGNERVWNWICERGRGFSKDDLAKITRWSEEYARLHADAIPSVGDSPRS
ncbi:hypothetical protein [Sphingomonas lacusdianchii]|uniref:hypothetical protein n=1 Tax=Sphingomonas lacusdianchii TaxID=2917992 RepID=UPI001F5A0431|nr:hypothetical protein [Sphingomonas sp. JXJ CY 53]